MKLAQRYLPVGNLPYDNIKLITAMEAKLFCNMPFIAVLPAIDENDTVERHTFENIPGIVYVNNKMVMRAGSEKYKAAIADLDRAFNNPTSENLEPYSFEAVFLEKFCQMIKKFKPKNACINLLGPFTISQKLLNTAKEQTLADKNFRKLYVEAVCVKGLWAINKIKEFCKETVPIIMLEEPMFGQFGTVKRENDDITTEIVRGMFEKVIEKLKAAGAIVGIQCMEKCDWSIPINSGVDIISYDAYNNPNNLCIIPEILTDFLRKGGIVNWGIVPVLNESMVNGLTVDYLSKRLYSTMGGVILAGVPADLVQNSATVSLNGDIRKLPVFYAEKAVMMASNLGSRLNMQIRTPQN